MLSDYKELQQFIMEDFHEFLQDGLSLSQTTEKLLVEYYRGITNDPIEKLVIYLKIALLSLDKNYLRKDLKNELNNMISNLELMSLNKQLNGGVVEKVMKDIEDYKIRSKNSSSDLNSL
ncbi:Imm3 family immunity protein [Saccharibacillus sacchari]|uniref:Imm3 family immunity protein n=1 Tax=Saccharibacillus sacchari TaxID=456493 RepID=UPI00055E70B9|nr:Imm3 family immunity protein [Saccharibacillus sacchari]